MRFFRKKYRNLIKKYKEIRNNGTFFFFRDERKKVPFP